jgi:hypothetical protein
MPAPSWPGSLPQYSLRDSHRVSPDDSHLIRSEMEGGSPMVRRKRLDIWTDVSMELVLSTSQYATLRSFWRNDLNTGAARFTMPIWNFSGALVTKTCIWKGGFPNPVPFGQTHIKAAFTVSVLDYDV